MLRAFWTWDPVSSTTFRPFDEPNAYANNKWFFDKSVWQKMFRTMSQCGFNGMVLANTHPFPFMIDLALYPEARIIDEGTRDEYERMHHWIFETAIQYDIAPYLLFFSIYYPDQLMKARGISRDDVTTHSDFAVEYTHYCTRTLLQTYPELAGMIGEASETIAGKREEFIQQAIVDAADAVRPDLQLYLRGWCGDPTSFVTNIKRRGNRFLKYSVKYTWEHIVDANPDPAFTRWVDTAGAENVAAEFWISNFEPWGSFSYDTASQIVGNLEEMGCNGFSMHPLSVYEWPHTSDTYFKYQWQRDMVWYSVWGGSDIDTMLESGTPKWLSRNEELVPGFQAGSRILELVTLYFGGDKQNQWHPQSCSLRDYTGQEPRLFSIEDMLNLDDQKVLWGRNWYEEITGDKVIHLSQYIESGTPEDAYGPDELIVELADLSEQAIKSGEQGLRSASREKELLSSSRDALCMGKLGEFYVERLKAALAHGRGEDAEALEHMAKAIELYKAIAAIDSAHRGPTRVITGRHAISGDWNLTITALEAEYEDASNDQFNRGADYPFTDSVV